MFDVIVMGNITDDTILKVSGSKNKSFGGGVTYAAFCLRALGAKVGIVGNVGREFQYLQKFKGIDLSGVKLTKESTKFELEYEERVIWDGPRSLKLLKNAGKIESFPEEFANARAVIFGPIFKEVTPQLIRSFSCPIKAIDLQGILREKAPNNRIFYKISESLRDFLEVDIIKIGQIEACTLGSSIPEICEKVNSPRAKAILVTFGERGSVVYDCIRERVRPIPAYKTKVADPTGTGDTYLSSFVYNYLKTQDIVDSAYFASAAASFVVEGMGPSKFGGLNEIVKRSSALRQIPVGKSLIKELEDEILRNDK
jgi:sugar/nucleoside kinase (ribokinase family)